jgi:hypothetical protein
MAKKTAKAAKDKKKPVKKVVAKPAPKKAAAPKATAKPVKKAVLVKKPPTKAAPATKKAAPAKSASVKAAPKVASKVPVVKASGKGLLKAVGKAIASVAKKAVEKAPASVKAAKPVPEAKAAKESSAKLKAKVPPAVEQADIEAPGEEELVDEEIVLTDADGRRYCRVKDCDQLAAVDGYCRYHYLALWKKIQVRKKILSEGKLERYIEELTARYPDKFLEMLRKDLRSDKEFLAAIQELEIDENADNGEFEDEAQNYIDEVRGMEPAARDDDDF